MSALRVFYDKWVSAPVSDSLLDIDEADGTESDQERK